MQTTYASWVGQPVILQVVAGELKVPVRGVVVGESEEAVRLRIGEGWDVDIFKTMIAAVGGDRVQIMH